MRTAIVHLSDRCNLRCVFCFERDDPTRRGLRDPATGDALAELDALRRRGTEHLTFMGAETFFRRDLSILLAHARDAGFTRVGVVTNGTVLSKPGFLAPLVAAGLDFVELSIHGHSPEIANAIAGAGFAWERQRLAMRELAGAGVATIVNTVVCRANREHLVDLAAYVADRLGAALLWWKPKFMSYAGATDVVAGGGLRYDEVDPLPLAAWARANERRLAFWGWPLCRLGPEAALAHELATLATDERYFEVDHGRGARYVDRGHQLGHKAWPAEVCGRCTVAAVCPGVERSYLAEHGAGELAPRADDPRALLAEALARAGLSRGDAPSLAPRALEHAPSEASADLSREDAPSLAPRGRDHAAASEASEVRVAWRSGAHPEPLVLSVAPADPARPAFRRTPRFALSYAPWSSGDPYACPDVASALAAALAALAEADRAGASLAEAGAALEAAAPPGFRAAPAEAGPVAFEVPRGCAATRG
ncbi:MAG: radical SAM protein [Sandaracinaceae bacterium]|nr:radical SAM protein [Sandaracinaceae bacterium]